MWLTVHMSLSVLVVGSVILFVLGFGAGWTRARITRRKRRS